MAEITRRPSVPVNVGGVCIGGTYPIAVQSMTNTDTADVASTVKQTEALAAAGSELVRITVNTREAAQAVPRDRPYAAGQAHHGTDHRGFPLQRSHIAA